MADDDDSQKTEEPTQKRLDEAHDRGQVAVSRELNHWFMFGGGLIAVFVFGPQAVRTVAQAVTLRTYGLAGEKASFIAMVLRESSFRALC